MQPVCTIYYSCTLCLQYLTIWLQIHISNIVLLKTLKPLCSILEYALFGWLDTWIRWLCLQGRCTWVPNLISFFLSSFMYSTNEILSKEWQTSGIFATPTKNSKKLSQTTTFLPKYLSWKRWVPGLPPSQPFHMRSVSRFKEDVESWLFLPYVHCQANLSNIYFDHININTYDISTMKIPWLSEVLRSGKQQIMIICNNDMYIIKTKSADVLLKMIIILIELMIA